MKKREKKWKLMKNRKKIINNDEKESTYNETL